MSTNMIAQTATTILANNRRTAISIVTAQCTGLERLARLPGKLAGSFSVNTFRHVLGNPAGDASNAANDYGQKVTEHTSYLIENYGRQATRTIDWVAEWAEEGIAKAQSALRSKPDVEIERFVVPSLNFLETLSSQAALMAEKFVDFVNTGADGVVVTETAAAKQVNATKHNESKSVELIETAAE